MTLRLSRGTLTQLVGVWSLWVAGCGATQGTQRVFAGQTVAGPYIEPQAYAAYAEGSYLEARGDWTGAERAYQRALARDRDSPGIWTRLGVIACRRNLELALEHFQTDGVSKAYAPAWAERARCLREHRDALGALDSARRAVLLDPDNAVANLLIADVYSAQAQPSRASAWLFAWLLRDPSAASHWRSVLERGIALKDRELEGLARAEVNRQRAPDARDDAFTGAAPEVTASADLEAALRSGDVSLARINAGERGISMRGLALLAIANGQPSVALAQAELLLAAAPNDGNALVAALFASALLGDAAKLATLLRHDHRVALPEAELAEQMADLLRWYAGDAAAGEWQLAYERARVPR